MDERRKGKRKVRRTTGNFVCLFLFFIGSLLDVCQTRDEVDDQA